METNLLGDDVNARVSLTPLLEFWEKHMATNCSHMKSMYSHIRERIAQCPDIQGEIRDIGVINEHYDIVRPLMSAVFPTATFEKDIVGALTPCSFEPFFVSPKFQRLFIDNDYLYTTLLQNLPEEELRKKRLKIYHLVLDRVYGFKCQRLESMDIKVVPDQNTGLPRYYGFTADFQFVRITPPLDLPRLSPQDMAEINENLTRTEVLSRHIDLSRFKFTGFSLVRAMDVTESEVISALERDLIDQQSIFSSDGIRLLEKRVQTLFQRPDVNLAIAAVRGGQVMVIKKDCNSTINCLFSNSHHINLDELEGSVWLQAAEGRETLRISDLSKKANKVPAEEQAVAAGIRSMLLSPLHYQGETIGLIEAFTLTPDDLGPIEALLLEQVTPILSVALKRGVDQMDKQVQSIIKEKCTAVHPSVEWRFEEAALRHMDRLRKGDTASEIEPIIFKDVVPFYGQADVRGSSLARNKGIQEDLTRQLTLAREIMTASEQHRPWPIIQEFGFRIQRHLDRIAKGVTSSDENAVYTLLNHDVAPAFDELSHLGPDVAKKIDTYRSALEGGTGLVYDRRRDYEESVYKLNQALSAFLEKEDSRIQESFPHYFEKRQTDGVDYMMYIGASMTPGRRLAPFHIQDMTLWQLTVACGLAWQTEKVKPRLKVPLDTCHLILVNHTPLSIRFRFDEKRFDVDGAYDVRQEIIKSRLDKALVKGSGDRLTQPGRIAVAYATPAEGKEIRRHIRFLTAQGKLHDDLEFLDLDDMPDVRGLKAIRVGVDAAAQGANVIEMRAG